MDCDGYEAWQTLPGTSDAIKGAGPMPDALGSFAAFNIGEMKFPEAKIGELATKAEDWLSQKVEKVEAAIPGTPEAKATVAQEVIGYAEKHWPKAAGAQPPASRQKLRCHRGSALKSFSRTAGGERFGGKRFVASPFLTIRALTKECPPNYNLRD